MKTKEKPSEEEVSHDIMDHEAEIEWSRITRTQALSKYALSVILNGVNDG